MKKRALVFACLLVHPIFCKNPTEPGFVQERIGNLSLPVSQQLSPLMSFGQNIVDKHNFQCFVLASTLQGDVNNRVVNTVAPSILYGIRNDLSLFVSAPILTKKREGLESSKGLQDVFAQLEYVFYEREKPNTSHQATVVGYVALPTGSATTLPETGYGSPSFFLGITASHLDIDWMFFASPGIVITTKNNNTKFGNSFLYQGGIGKNIMYKSNELIVSWLIELNGTYQQRAIINGCTDNNSGGNSVLLGPSLWISTQHLIAQCGISCVVSEKLFGTQFPNDFMATLNIGWKFNS